METHQKQDICCPEFDPAAWDEKLFEWRNKSFIKDSVATFFYMPLNFSKVMRRLDKKVTDAQAVVPDWLCLSDHTSPWKMDLYLAVDKDVEGAEKSSISGKFFSKVYEGPYKNAGKWTKDFEAFTTSRNMNVSKMYTWYTTCPKCAKKYGKNYVVLMGKTI